MKDGTKILVVVEDHMLAFGTPTGTLMPAVVKFGGAEWFAWSWETRADASGWDGDFKKAEEGVRWCAADDPVAVAALRASVALR